MSDHSFFMNKAIEISKSGYGYTNPNPIVGCVIVKDNKVIGQGYHKAYGQDHAEINAIKNSICDLSGSTMYVTLEPCSHYGNTPPCVNAIIDNNISKVYVSVLDPNPLVSGRGIKKLRDHDIEVHVGLLSEKTQKTNEIFLKYIKDKTPFVTLKSAISLDGKIATYNGDSKWISCEESREMVHELRHRNSAIMVGINTVLKDDPALTTRLKSGVGNDPIKIIVDSTLKIPINSHVLTSGCSKTIVATTRYHDTQRYNALTNLGVEVLVLDDIDRKVNLWDLYISLGKLGIDSILIEGGGTLAFSALDAGIIDKLILYIAPIIIGGENSKGFVSGKGVSSIKDAFKINDLYTDKIGTDIYIEGYVNK